MKKIKNRAYFAAIIALALVAGLGFYLFRLAVKGDEWVMLRANQSVFNQGVLDTGTVTDRNGVLLAKAGDGIFSYNEDSVTRAACLHAVGDFAGNFGSGALSIFNEKLIGYSFVNGVNSVSGQGGTVKLSIDAKLQKTAQNALWGRRGAVLVSNYETGEILTMVSSPNYDPQNIPNLDSGMYEGVYINRALGASFVPGSVFKLVTLAAAIENMPDLYTKTFNCAGSVIVGDEKIACTGIHGQQTIEQALAHSCNCAFSEISQELGGEIIEKYARNYGLLDSLDVNGVSTAIGNFEICPKDSGDLSWSGIGQHKDLVSPISMLRLVSAIGNGGHVAEPTLLAGGGRGKTQLLKTSTAEKIADMMNYNVTAAYGQWVFPNLKISAKTGTAEVGDGTSHAWVVGFLEDDDHPLAFTVIIENAGGGLANAGPVVNAVLQAAVAPDDIS